jgi:hypothetical protein
MAIGRRMRWAACFVAVSGFAATTPYIGAKACGTCHPAQSASQALSAHAAALFRAPEHPLAGSFPIDGKLTRKPNYNFEFFRVGGEIRTRILDAVDVMELPMEWAFGAGRQAVTFVTKVDKDWYVEHYSTYYSAQRSWGATPGQDAINPTSLAEAAGLLYKTSDPNTGIAGCFECHSTGPVVFGSDGEAHPGEQGVRCETCHGAGAAHVQNPARKNIRNPAALPAAQVNEFCGKCHRPPAAKGVTIDWNYSWNVRHQPIYLNESACFRKSRGALSCFTCHDPHEAAAKKDAAYYNNRCVGCHSASRLPPKQVCLAEKPANCIDCHMPLVSPQATMRFTNHWIGIYRGGAKLKPVR